MELASTDKQIESRALIEVAEKGWLFWSLKRKSIRNLYFVCLSCCRLGMSNNYAHRWHTHNAHVLAPLCSTFFYSKQLKRVGCVKMAGCLRLNLK